VPMAWGVTSLKLRWAKRQEHKAQ